MRPRAATDLARRSSAILTERLERDVPAPVLIAFSGGGDSLALLLIAKAWAAAAGRRLIAVTMDHGLQARGEAWAHWCVARARDLEVDCKILRWTAAKPAAGLPAAARAARHRLIASAAREAGARVVLMGHTLDDALEAAVMREAGVHVSAPRVWSPSPVWPEGRDIFILRPLGGARRRDIRDWLAHRRESWIEDPANRDPASPRARARALIAACPDGPAAADAAGEARWPRPEIGPTGAMRLSAAALADLPWSARRAFLAAAVVCVAGVEAPPRGRTVDHLMARLEAGTDMAATLAGARVEKSAGLVSITRETARRDAALQTKALPIGEAVVWDGRFEITAAASNLGIRPLAGAAGRLAKRERQRLLALPPAARRMAPALVDETGAVSCPILGLDPRVSVRCLIESRLGGASGCIQGEVAIRRVAKPFPAS